MENKVLKGKPVADKLTEKIISEVEDILGQTGNKPTLAMVRVGNREDDLSYQRAASNRCKKCGIDTVVVELDENCSMDEYIDSLEKLNGDTSVTAILCFRPLPKGLDEDVIKNIISPEKDVDCFSPINLAKLFSGEKDGFVPCTPMGVVEILDFYGIDVEGKNVVVIGRSMVVGKPLSIMLTNRNATVTICHSKSKNLSEICSKADILISCIGVGRFVKKEFVREGAVVIDVGINFDEDGNMMGDVDYDEVLEQSGGITPVPGGVGAVTTSILASQVLKAFKNTL